MYVNPPHGSSFRVLTLPFSTPIADGIVRLYRNYDPSLDQGPLQLVSAFRALNEVVQVRQGAGLVMDWKQAAGTLLVGGDSRAIKMWDAQTETQGLVCIPAPHCLRNDNSSFMPIGPGY